MKVKDLLEKNRTYIVSSYAIGVSTTQLGKEFDISNASVYLFLRDTCGVQMRKQTSIDDYKEDILKYYQQGLSGYAIAKETGLNPSTCERYCKKLGLDFSANSKNREITIKSQSKEIVVDYHSGLGCTRLAKKYNTTESSICRLLRGQEIDPLYLKVYNIPHTFFDEINTEQKAYILGFFTADGCNNKNNSFEISITDKDILYEMRDAMGYDGPIYHKISNKKNRKDMYQLSMHSKRISKRLSELGCPHKKTFLTYMPTLPIDLHHHYIRGLIDGDGSFHKCGNHWFLTIAGTKQLLEDVQDVFIQHNITTHIYKHGNIHILRIHRNEDLKRAVKWIYKDATIKLNRKAQTAFKLYGV